MLKRPKEEVPDKDAKLTRPLSKIIVPDYFPLKYIRRKYSLHHVAFPGTWQIDLMIGNNITNWFLVAIEVNTRYLFIERTSTYVYDNECNKIKDKNGDFKIAYKSAYAVACAFQNLKKHGWDPSVIVSDHEKAFSSDFLKEHFFNKYGVTHKPVYLFTDDAGKKHSNHTSLAIVDRVIRSCRKWVETQEYQQHALPADKVAEFVEYYNNRPHSKLCKIFKNKTITPQMVHDNMEMEMVVMQHILSENKRIRENTRGFRIPPGSLVRIYNPPAFKESRKTKTDPYVVLGNNGNIYKVKNVNEKLKNPKEELVPRIWLDYL